MGKKAKTKKKLREWSKMEVEHNKTLSQQAINNSSSVYNRLLNTL